FEISKNGRTCRGAGSEISRYVETDLDKKEQELGDVFFSLINYARISGINPDSALERTNLKFISRFQKMEGLAEEQDLKLADMSRLILIKKNRNWV
ncbi:MazG nucleotide pyrophosphohydrolase domain-containing protein, partial [Chryseobacterium sp. CH1]|uniref:MazG nucleotide pyrophosphohydrolase domain-containing protein n=1 Tax=Chryseobacterium sp. CH1 TaxID=713551 RepID=UPI002938D89F